MKINCTPLSDSKPILIFVENKSLKSKLSKVYQKMPLTGLWTKRAIMTTSHASFPKSVGVCKIVLVWLGG